MIAAWFAIVPVGKNSAASFPSSSATRASRRRVVGSPSRWSSPTSAAAMAWRMAAVGRVTVSLRRSIGMARKLAPTVGRKGGRVGARARQRARAVGAPARATTAHRSRDPPSLRARRDVTASSRVPSGTATFARVLANVDLRDTVTVAVSFDDVDVGRLDRRRVGLDVHVRRLAPGTRSRRSSCTRPPPSAPRSRGSKQSSARLASG